MSAPRVKALPLLILWVVVGGSLGGFVTLWTPLRLPACVFVGAVVGLFLGLLCELVLTKVVYPDSKDGGTDKANS